MTEDTREGMTCPSCGKDASGNFCRHCGAALGGRFCNKCGSSLREGAQFCDQCGAPRAGGVAAPVAGGAAGGGARPVEPIARPTPSGASSPAPRTGASARRPPVESAASSNLPWIIVAVSLFALIAVIGVTMIDPAGPSTAAPAAPGGTAGGAAPDISQMTPREAADRLFDRVMRTLSAGDTAGAMAFQPMGVQAYQRAEPLDLDGVFHLSMLQMLTDPTAALASAERILEVEPNHIFALGIKAQASDNLGDEAAARGAYQQLVDAYPAEESNVVLYDGHLDLLPRFRADAEGYLAGG